MVGKRKNSIALSALRIIQANNFSRQIGIPGLLAAISVWRERKKLVSSILNSPPHPVVRFKASGHLEMCWHLYSWGKSVEVLQPARLRQMVHGHQREFEALP